LAQDKAGARARALRCGPEPLSCSPAPRAQQCSSDPVLAGAPERQRARCPLLVSRIRRHAGPMSPTSQSSLPSLPSLSLLPCLLLAHLACGPWAATGQERPQRYLITSSPGMGNVYYAGLPSFHDLTLPPAERPVSQASVLIDGFGSRCKGWSCNEASDLGLRAPRGLALHQACDGRAVLYVSDTEAENIYAYTLTGKWGSLQVGSQRRVRMGVPGGAPWLAVDGLGNLFYTTKKAGLVEMISAESLAHRASPEPVTLYSAAEFGAAVSGPAGVVADNFYVYWANQPRGEVGAFGTLVRAPERSLARTAKREAAGRLPPRPQALVGASDSSTATASNICLARENLFFTGTGSGSTHSLFATKIRGGSVAEISNSFTRASGCVYDDETTLYVADAGDDAIYSLPANFASLRAMRHLRKAVAVPEPHQLAIFSPGRPIEECGYTPRHAAWWQSSSTRHGDHAMLLGIVALILAVEAQVADC